MTSAPDTENTHCPRTIAILVVKDMITHTCICYVVRASIVDFVNFFCMNIRMFSTKRQMIRTLMECIQQTASQKHGQIHTER